jgi:hypothetical protein
VSGTQLRVRMRSADSGQPRHAAAIGWSWRMTSSHQSVSGLGSGQRTTAGSAPATAVEVSPRTVSVLSGITVFSCHARRRRDSRCDRCGLPRTEPGRVGTVCSSLWQAHRGGPYVGRLPAGARHISSGSGDRARCSRRARLSWRRAHAGSIEKTGQATGAAADIGA